MLPSRHPGARGPRRHRAHHRPLALRARREGGEGQGPQRPRHADLHGRGAADRRGAGRGRGSRRRPSRSSSGSRRPRTRTRPNRRPEPCTPSWGWGTPARSTTKPGTMPGFDWPTTSPRAGGSAPSRAASGRGRRQGTWDGRPVRVLKPQTYMNRSGAALAPLRALPDFDPAADLLVLVDDVALPGGEDSACAARARRAATTASRASRARSSGRTTPASGSASGRCPPASSELADFVLGAVRAGGMARRRRAARPDVRGRRMLAGGRHRAGDEPVQPVRHASLRMTRAPLLRDPIAHAETRHRRPAQRRQVHPLQRPHLRQGAGGQLSVRHDRAQHRDRPGARPAAGCPGADREAGAHRARRRSSSWTSPGWSRARARARAWATSSWRTSARWTPSSTWSAASRTTTSSTSWARSIRCATARSSTSSSAWPTWRASRSGSTRPPAPPSPATRRPRLEQRAARGACATPWPPAGPRAR